jgi:ABC-type multidrug transport system fused ATPase/permease subunit
MKFQEIILKLCRRHALFLVIAAVMLTIASFIEACAIFSFAPMIDLLLKPDLSQASGITLKITRWMSGFGMPISVVSVIIFVICVAVVKGLFSVISQFITTKVHFRLVKGIIFDVFGAFIGARWQFFVSKNYGVLGNTLIKETEKMGLAFEAVAMILSILLRVVFYMGIAFLISWKLSSVILVLIGIVLMPFWLLGRRTYKIGRVHTSAANEFQGTIAETFNAAKLILGFGNQNKAISRLAQKIPPFITSAIQYIMIRVISPLAFEPMGIAVMLAAIYMGITHYKLNVSELLIILYAMRTSSNLAFQITHQRNYLQNMAPALEQIYSLKAEAEKMRQPSGEQKFEGFKKEIALKDVSFTYPGQQRLFDSINLAIPKGKMVALVGKSGSGKTTLIDILMGLYEPEKGAVLIDGVPLSKFDIISWRQKIGFVPQDSFLFHLSIKDNLLWGSERASKKEIYQACEKANVTEFTDRLPEKLDTVVGERGIRLSGGQRQRVAIARAVLRKPEILILDEATSALDSHSELLIQKSVESISQDTTVIIIAHRLSTIKGADYIYVFEQGSIIESGSFDDLMRIREGEFFKAVELQKFDQPALKK